MQLALQNYVLRALGHRPQTYHTLLKSANSQMTIMSKPMPNVDALPSGDARVRTAVRNRATPAGFSSTESVLRCRVAVLRPGLRPRGKRRGE